MVTTAAPEEDPSVSAAMTGSATIGSFNDPASAGAPAKLLASSAVKSACFIFPPKKLMFRPQDDGMNVDFGQYFVAIVPGTALDCRNSGNKGAS